MEKSAKLDNARSSNREAVMEHLFVGEMLRHLWLRGCVVEVLRPEVDAAGYDVVFDCNRVLRHVQFKSSVNTAKTARVNVHTALINKTSGCVIWMHFNPATLAFTSFGWFGGEPGQALPCIKGHPVAKHAKGNVQGEKLERPDIRIVKKSEFVVVANIEAMAERLFGLA